jgi:cellulose synthase/poly-beta-1,6-N-acetylglucosamine synthase-like glycosyltransferase
MAPPSAALRTLRNSVPLPRAIPGSASRASAYRFFLIIGALGALVVWSAITLWRRDPVLLFWITLGYFSYELGLNVLLVVAAWFGLRARRLSRAGNAPAPSLGERTPSLSVLIAAHNERSCIFTTLESVFAQAAVSPQVIIASDGSSDGMNEEIIARYTLRPDPAGAAAGGAPCWRDGTSAGLCLLALPKVGKGRALNAGLALVSAEVVVTLDADTRLAPGALAALGATFEADEVTAAGGFVYVRNAAGGPWLARYQYWEYVKNFMWRIGLAHLGVCLQVSGAFGAFRTRILREIGGFSGTSLVEDYEVIYRLHEHQKLAGTAYRVEVAPDAVAYTESPETVPSFVHQRTRWFAGFLQTLWSYRRLVGHPRMGLVGALMLPIKCVDAILPLWGFLSLAILVAAAAGGTGHWQKASLILFGVRWGVDLLLGGVMWRWHRSLFPGRPHALPGGLLALHMATEGLVFNWFRQIAVLNAYGWFVRRVQKWHQPRWGQRPG